jgi:hypothetical protein
MLERSRFVKGGVAKHNDAHAVLLNALADKENSYRRWMRPADIIAQNMSERPKPKRVVLSPGLAERLWEFLGREFKRRMPTGLKRFIHSQELRNQEH